ncbi:MAG: hypothetical protein KGZ69_11985 [Methylomonas sp.]|nr:hypothetical protein [Methylomonas sp.]
MAYEPKPNSGALFKNEKTKPTQPDYTGNWTDAAGKEWRLAAWLKDGNVGKFLSISASEKLIGSRPRQETKSQDDLDDAIPF